jgi:hypothetical protein
MAGYSSVDLGFEPLQMSAADAAEELLTFLADRHNLDLRSIRSITKIVMDDNCGWADSIAVRVVHSVHGTLRDAGPAFSISVRISIGQAFYPIKIQLAPVAAAGLADNKAVCASLKLGSGPYEAIFGFRPRDEGLFDEQAKLGLLQLSLGATTQLKSHAFMLTFEEADFVCWPLPQVMHRLLHPDMTLRGSRPGLLSGISGKVVDLEVLVALWGPERMYEARDGFLVLDDLVPDFSDEPD